MILMLSTNIRKQISYNSFFYSIKCPHIKCAIIEKNFRSVTFNKIYSPKIVAFSKWTYLDKCKRASWGGRCRSG